MKYKANWDIQNHKDSGTKSAANMTSCELIDLASNLKQRDDVIYTYHPKYMKLGARIALWGTGTSTISIDIQFSAHAYVGKISVEQLPEFFENYTGYITNPEQFGLQREE